MRQQMDQHAGATAASCAHEGTSAVPSTSSPTSMYDPLKTKHRRRTTSEQLKVLEYHFDRNHKPDMTLRRVLAEQLGMTPREIQVWFQNRRAKVKKLREKAADKEKSDTNLPGVTWGAPQSVAGASSTFSLGQTMPSMLHRLPTLPQQALLQPGLSPGGLAYPTPALESNENGQGTTASGSRDQTQAHLSNTVVSLSLPTTGHPAGAGIYPSPISATGSCLSTPSPSEHSLGQGRALYSMAHANDSLATEMLAFGSRPVPSLMPGSSHRHTPQSLPNHFVDAGQPIPYSSATLIRYGTEEFSSNGSSSDREGSTGYLATEASIGLSNSAYMTQAPHYSVGDTSWVLPVQGWQPMFGMPTPAEQDEPINFGNLERRASCPAGMAPELDHLAITTPSWTAGAQGLLPPSSAQAGLLAAQPLPLSVQGTLVHRRHSLAPLTPASGCTIDNASIMGIVRPSLATTASATNASHATDASQVPVVASALRAVQQSASALMR
ncbi:hypothetical protein OIO90_001833 [Microbotryomycetes sp. JL221]|nr:hypothetical protein OIO90_001833 [Microbotryomycetes sp. JL221]